MSEKQFTLDDEENGLCRCILVDGEEIPTCEICDLLNELSDENGQLKEENEQLKNDNLLFFQQVFNILMKYQHLFNREMADEVLEDLGIELTEWFE